jgi:PAS domain S-box-containing protein
VDLAGGGAYFRRGVVLSKDDKLTGVDPETRVLAEQVKALYSKGRVAFLTVVVNSGIVAFVLWPSVDHARVASWLVSLYVVTLPRLLLHAVYVRRAPPPAEAHTWGRLFTLGTFVNGIIWGAGGYGLYAADSLGAQVLLIFVLGGMCAGAASSTATYPPAFPAFAVPALLPVVVRLAGAGDRVHWAMAVMLTLFGLAMTTIARTGGRHLVESARLRFKNLALAQNLDEARAHLEVRVKDRTAEVLAQKELLQKVFDHSPVMLLVCDADGVVVRINRCLEERLGWSLGDYAREEVHAAVFAGEETKSGAWRDVESTTKSGARLHVSWASVRLSDGMTIRIGQDVTERKRAEEALALSQRVTSVGLMAAGVAHEINNPLAFLLANHSFLKERLLALKDELVADPRAARGVGASMREVLDALADAQTGAERVRRIVADMRALSYGEDTPPRPIAVTQALETSLRMLANDLAGRARLVTDLGPVPLVAASETRLSQVFLNLVSNAIQATPPGEPEAHEIRIVTGTEPDGRARVEVHDAGRGIPKDALPRIFDPFFSTKPLGQGAGLGLAIVHGIVKSAGGEVRVASELGRGTVVTVLLPAAPPAPPEPTPGPAMHSSSAPPHS